MVDDLLALGRSWRPDLVVYDALTLAGPLVARLLGVPAVRHLFGPDCTYLMNATGMAAVMDRFGVDDVDLAAWPVSIRARRDCKSRTVRRIRYRFVPYPGLAEVPLMAEPTKPRICLTWGPSVHRLLGERAFLPAEVVLGCARLANERGADLVLAITASQRRMLGDLPAGVQVAESVPLDVLLPTCQAVVHQGGAGTMLTALRHGLPQLIVTQMLDQAANAFQLVAAGAGLTLPAAGLGSADVLATGFELLDDSGYRTAACRLQREMLDQPTPAEVVADLTALIR